MSGFFEVLGGMTAGRRVAAADMSADEALTQFHPPLSGFNTFLTNVAAGLHFAIRLFQMFALRHGASDENLAWMTIPVHRIRASRLALRRSGTTQARNRVSIMKSCDGFIHDSDPVWQH
jgi:hypothetical protein